MASCRFDSLEFEQCDVVEAGEAESAGRRLSYENGRGARGIARRALGSDGSGGWLELHR